MDCTILATNLLAQYSKWQRMGDGLHRSRGRADFSDLLPYLLGIAVVCAIIAAVVAYIKHNDLSQPCDNPNKLFRELSRAHGLDRSSQRLLRRLASYAGLSQPAMVFLTPTVFDEDQIPDELYEEEERLSELHDWLF
jgi:hypothetical protein